MALAGVLPGALRSAAAVDGAAALLAAARPTPPLRPHLAAAACAGKGKAEILLVRILLMAEMLMRRLLQGGR